MAPLTWRNVEAPNFSGVTQALAASSDILRGATQDVGSAIDKYQAKRRQANISADAAKIASFGTQQELQAALSSGAFVPQDAVSAELAMNRGGTLLNQDVTRGTIANNGLRLKAGEFELGRSQTLAGRADDQFAATQTANPLLAKAFNLAESGDREGANKIILENGPLFAKAGISDVNALVNNRTAYQAGQDLTRKDVEFEKFTDTVSSDRSGKKLGEFIAANPNQFDTPDRVNKFFLDPRIKEKFSPDEINAGLEYTKKINFDPAVAADRAMKSSLGIPDTGSQPTGGLAGLLAKKEGGGRTDTLFGHSQKPGGAFEGVDVSKMTVGQVLEFQRPDGPYADYVKSKVGRVATPVGAIQVVGTTLRNAAKEMGLDPNTPFNADTQQAVFNHLADKRLSGPRTMEGKMQGMRQEWEGFKSVPDRELASAITAYEAGDRGAFGAFTGSDSSGSSNQSNGLLPTVGAGAGFNTMADPSMGLTDSMDRLLSEASGSNVLPPLETSGTTGNSSAASSGSSPTAAPVTGNEDPLTRTDVANQTRTDRAINQALAPTETTIALPDAEINNRTVDITNVNPADTQFMQDVQTLQRKGDIQGAVSTIADRVAVGREGAAGSPGGRMLGSVVDYFTADPATSEANAAQRERSAAALNYWKSPETKDYFQKNPNELNEAIQDPIGFAEDKLGQRRDKDPVPVDQMIKETLRPTNQNTNTINAQPVVEASVPDMIRTAESTIQVDRASNLNGRISQSLSDPEADKKSVLQVSNELKTGGLSVNDTERESAIATLANELNINPATAGVLIENSINDVSIFGGLFGKESGIDLDKAREIYARYKDGNDISKGVSVQDTVARKAEAQRVIAEVKTQYTQLEAAYKQRLIDASPFEKEKLTRDFKQAEAALKTKLKAVSATGVMTTYTSGDTRN